MPEECLDQSRIGAFVGQGIAGRMPQHVRMRLDIQPGQLACFPDDVLQGVDRKRAAALGLEHIAAADLLAQFAQVAQFVAIEAVRAVDAALQPDDVECAGVEVELRPAQADGFAGSQAMAIDRRTSTRSRNG